MKAHQVCVCNRTPCPNNIQLVPNQNLPHISVRFANRPLNILVDTGAQIPLLDEEFCLTLFDNKSPPVVKYTNKIVSAIGCDGTPLQISGSIVGKFQFHRFDDPPLFAEFYLLNKCSQKCIFPFPWLKALKVCINLNSLSLEYEHPTTEGCLLQAEGDLIRARLHEQPFWLGISEKQLHHCDENSDEISKVRDDHHDDLNDVEDLVTDDDLDDGHDELLRALTFPVYVFAHAVRIASKATIEMI